MYIYKKNVIMLTLLALDFKLLQLYLKVDKLANILINDCQMYNKNSTNEIYETLVSYFVLKQAYGNSPRCYMNQIDYCKIINPSHHYHNQYDNYYIYIYMNLFFICMVLLVDVYVRTSITVHYHICYLRCMIL